MNCEKCQELLSEFLDGTLGHSEHTAVGAHLAACASCDAARQDFHAIIAVARDVRGQVFLPADERALWLRVQAEVETESRPVRAAATSAAGGGFWSRLFGRRFELSLPQMAAGAAALVVAAASVTAVGLRFASTDARPERAAAVRRVVSDDSYPRTYLEPHEASMRYWEQRVEARRASWNPRMRASFDRSVLVLDQSVKDSLDDLQKNPHDEVAEEMLNAALHDKVELMREFSEQ
ncbi:MAG: zf-HC2 domain-containing protein [Acidobacteria bacterium]|nr:zf-HC2 domain-containing protein [Acidobacteriota bacterium]